MKILLWQFTYLRSESASLEGVDIDTLVIFFKNKCKLDNLSADEIASLAEDTLGKYVSTENLSGSLNKERTARQVRD